MSRQNWPLACVLVALAAAPLAAPVSAQDQIVSYNPDFFTSANPATAMDMINRLPGFAFDGGSGTRGFSGNAGNVQINGRRPASKNDSLNTVLSRILASEVERIDVISGGAPGIDMQGKAVIANVIRKSQETSSIVVTTGLYYLNTGRGFVGAQVQFSHTDGSRTYTLGIRRDPSFSDDMGGAEITRFDAAGNAVRTLQKRTNGGGNTSLNGSLETPLLNGDLSLNASVSQNEYSSGTTYYYATGPEEFDSTSRGQNAEVGANYQLDLGGAVLDLVALQRLGNSKSASLLGLGGTGDRSATLRETSESIGRTALRFALSDTITIEAGAEGAYNSLSGNSELSIGGVTVPVPSSDVDVSETRGEGFAVMNWQVRSDLMLETGIRAEYSTISQAIGAVAPRSFFYPKPRALLSWTIDPDRLLRLRVEHQVGQLNFGDFISSANLTQGHVTAGNPELQPDNRWQYEIAYEHRFWERGALTLSAQYHDIENLLDNKPIITPQGIFDVRGNIGSGVATRISLDATIPTDRLGIKGGLLNLEGDWSDSELTDPVTGLPRRLAGQDPHSYEASFTQDLTDLNSTWSVSYYQGWTENSYRLRQYNLSYGAPTMSASWTYRPSNALNFTFSVNNLMQAQRRSNRDYYDLPRNVGMVTRRETEISYSRPRFYLNMRKTFN